MQKRFKRIIYTHKGRICWREGVKTQTKNLKPNQQHKTGIKVELGQDYIHNS